MITIQYIILDLFIQPSFNNVNLMLVSQSYSTFIAADYKKFILKDEIMINSSIIAVIINELSRP